MSLTRDLFNNAKIFTLLIVNRVTQGSETVTQTTAADLRGYFGRAQAYLMCEIDASAAAADTVTIVVQKCTAADGTGATTIGSFTALAGTGVAQENREAIAIPLSGLGGLGTTYRYLRASAAIVDANSSGTYNIAVVLVAPGDRALAENAG